MTNETDICEKCGRPLKVTEISGVFYVRCQKCDKDKNKYKYCAITIQRAIDVYKSTKYGKRINGLCCRYDWKESSSINKSTNG